MGFWLFLVFLGIGLCLAEGKEQRRRFLGGVAALLYLPIGILFALIKNDK